MKQYAYIENNKIYTIIELQDDQSKPSNIPTMDITDVLPQPKEGWVYDKITDTFSIPYEETFDGRKEALLKQVKPIAQYKITTILSETKQRNSLYTLYKHNKKAKASLTSDEKAEIQDLESKWDKIEAIRTASNTIEAEINNLKTIEKVQAYTIQNNPLWPTT